MNDNDRFEKMAKLVNREYLITALENGKTRVAIAKEIGCALKTLNKAFRYHGITFPYVIKK